MKITKIIYLENFHIYGTYPCVCLCLHLPIFLRYVSCKSVCVYICVYCLCYVDLSLIDMCDCVHAFIYIAIYAIVHCFVLCGMCMRERLLSLQYKEAYDRELMQHGNTMQELVLVKQRLESEQESLAEADEAVRVAEAKLAENDVSNKCECVYVRVYIYVHKCVCSYCVYVYVSTY